MRSYYAQFEQQAFAGGYCDCLAWAAAKAMDNPSKMSKLFTARAGDRDARLLLEIDSERITNVTSSQFVAIKKLRGLVTNES